MSDQSSAAGAQLLVDRLRRAQSVARVGSWELDLRTGTMWASEEAFRIYGVTVTPDQRVPLPLAQQVPLPEYRPVLDRALADLVAGRGPYDVEFELARVDDGSRRFVHSRAELQRDAEGRAVVVLGTLQDITRRKAMESALRSSEERFRMILEYAADAIVLVSGESITELNGQACELTGYTREDLVGRALVELFSPAERARAPLRVDRLDRGEAVITEREITRKDGTTVPVEMHSKKLPNAVYLTIFRDISERRRLEEQLQLRQRMDSIGTLASGIAHDFNNILVTIIGYAELLRTEAPDLSAASREAAINVVKAAQRAADLVRRLQSLSRPDRDSQQAFDLHRVASEVFQILTETTDRRIRKDLRVPSGAFVVRGSESDIYHTLVNLGLNAVQAIESRGVGPDDLVHLDATEYEAQPADPMGLAPGRYVHVRFSDTGPGMPASVRERAFDPLFTTKQRGTRKGQGLGLTMVYNIVVQQHLGGIDIETAEGRGTTVHLYLPAGTDVSAAGVPADAASLRTGTILVVEDEASIANLARLVLERAGHRVLVVGDGVKAIEIFTTMSAGIDLVILDRTLPKLSGTDVMREMIRIRPDTRIVVSSGNLVRVATEFPHAARLLPKPYTPSQLIEAVGATLA